MLIRGLYWFNYLVMSVAEASAIEAVRYYIYSHPYKNISSCIFEPIPEFASSHYYDRFIIC
jgi:hypothetical protein